MSKPAEEDQDKLAESSRIALGRLFKQEREKKNLSILDMANELKVLSAAVKGIEEADYSSIRGEIFVRGYIKSYASFLGLSVDRCLEMYGHSPEAPEQPISHEPLSPPKIKKNDGLDTIVKILVPLIVFAIAWFSYDLLVGGSDAEVNETEVPVKVEEFAVDETRSVNVTDLKLQQDLASKMAEFDLLVSFEGSSTITVTDNEGSVLVDDELKRRGDLIELSGSPWYSLLIGYGENVKVFFKGEAVEFETSVENPVVRLELGEKT